MASINTRSAAVKLHPALAVLPEYATLPEAPRWRLSTVALLLGLVALIVISFISLPLQWGGFFTQEAVRTTGEFLHGFAPPELSVPFLLKIAIGTAETLSMSALGTILAAIAGVVLGLPASGRFGGVARAATRTLLNVLRSIPELVWASILLIAAGLGPFAGTLALAAHTSGVLGRLFADAYENTSSLPESTLRTNGVGAVPAFLYATLQQTLPQMMSYTLYRWENNIRAAAILGVVGAGGLGQMLKYHLSLFQMQQAANVILAMLVMVAVVDSVSFILRSWLTK
ncbi:phosphonate ABC transporter, permease protein PhnE [Glaciimonas sp. PCH181]|uniref:phosphonate ABC transporter, permease protein PhnE n=1 Tax=Glaciimonas sp. PCH181 TaxID=2133943 RepID=UPI000D3CDA93|nr:phosphonate ABC transporter, permease protein PhnE [Glaciimonas sp. PCH181]PUA16518.1 phosphonate ABC transporter, permease protein PhnE [Glaciimonas sp. PCH181]